MSDQQHPLDALVDLIAARVVTALAAGDKKEATPTGYLNVESAALFLDTSKDAIRQRIKRGQMKPHRAANGQPLFTHAQLVEWAEAGDAK